MFLMLSRFYNHFNYARSNPRDARRIAQRRVLSHLTNSLTFLILAWICMLYFGESSSFNKAVRSCEWSRWERWQEATPHHLVFIADPQLVDPHTYPGRPWPVSSLTIKHTDLYLQRAYSRIEKLLDPSTIIFLGDLFDGGREWSTSTSQSPEERYRQYGDSFWHQELDRFKGIFLRERSGTARQIIASLPGNHDLGFGKGIQKPVRDRFIAAFGDVNRVDIVANHTFVSLDTVSLSAKDAADEAGTEEIWKPTDDFLADVMTKQARAIEQSIHPATKHVDSQQAGEPRKEKAIYNLTTRSPMELPTVLLSHVPLYRAPGTPCGPLRERYPPTVPNSAQTSPVIPDDRNAISVSGGYQYQNVISEPLTHYIVSKLGSDLQYAFSGDDHDYCEVVHATLREDGGKILEITVKSISWAMGVRKPGFLMVSLWNPVDEHGKSTKSLGKGMHHQTMQTHLCLLPDQLSLFIRYAILFAISLLVISVRALILILPIPFFFMSSTPLSTILPLLPTSTPSVPTTNYSPYPSRRRAISSAEREKAAALASASAIIATTPPLYSNYDNYPGASTSKASPSPDDATLSVRTQGRSRFSTPSQNYTVDLPVDVDGTSGERNWQTDEDEERLYDNYGGGAGMYHGMDAYMSQRSKQKGKVRAVVGEWVWGLWYVGRVAVPWFIFLLFWA